MEHRQRSRRRVGAVLRALVLSGVLVGPAAAQDGPFQAIFEEGYDFLHKQVGNSVEIPDGRTAQGESPSQALFADSYAVTRTPRAGLIVMEPEGIAANTDRSPFETMFGEGYKRIVLR